MHQFMRELMAEFVNYGGMAATRAEVYADLLPLCGTKAADRFAFLPPQLTPDAVACRPRFDPQTREPIKI